MVATRVGMVTITGARIVFRNFAGKASTYNRAGARNFAVILDQETGAAMYEDGWNVKVLKPREEGDAEVPYVEVSVEFDKGRPPRVVMITSRGKTTLTGDEVEILDWADIENVDLTLNPYAWDVSGKTGIKAYLKSLYVTIHEDELDLKYADVRDAQAPDGDPE